MKCFFLFLLLTLGSLTTLKRAQADVFAWTYGMYLSTEKEEDNQKTKLTRFDRDITLGYISRQYNLLIGGTYGSEDITEIVRDSNNREIEYTYERTSLGVTAGYISSERSGPFVLGSYFTDSKQRSESQELGRYSTPREYQGKGYEAVVGYRLTLGQLHLSFHLAYRHYEYDSEKIKGSIQPMDPPTKENYILPFLGIWTQF